MNQDLDKFYHIVNQVYKNNHTTLWSLGLSHEQSSSIYEYILRHSDDNQGYVTTVALAAMPPNSTCQLPRCTTGLCVDLVILRDQNNEYILLLEIPLQYNKTDSLNPPHQKPLTSQTQYYRIDRFLTSSYQRIYPFGVNSEILDQDLELSRKFSHPKLLKIEGGPVGTMQPSMSFYFIEGRTSKTLFELMAELKERSATHESPYHQPIISDLLNAVEHLHLNGIVHQKISTQNVCLQLESQTSWRAQLSFVSLVTDRRPSTEYGLRAYEELLYVSPELIHHSLQSQTVINSSFYGMDVYKNHSHRLQRISCHGPQDYYVQHCANDLWSLGIVFANLLYSLEKPNCDYDAYINQHALLKGMLAPMRVNRFDIEISKAVLTLLSQYRALQNVNHPIHISLNSLIDKYQEAMLTYLDWKLTSIELTPRSWKFHSLIEIDNLPEISSLKSELYDALKAIFSKPDSIQAYDQRGSMRLQEQQLRLEGLCKEKYDELMHSYQNFEEIRKLAVRNSKNLKLLLSMIKENHLAYAYAEYSTFFIDEHLQPPSLLLMDLDEKMVDFLMDQDININQNKHRQILLEIYSPGNLSLRENFKRLEAHISLQKAIIQEISTFLVYYQYKTYTPNYVKSQEHALRSSDSFNPVENRKNPSL